MKNLKFIAVLMLLPILASCTTTQTGAAAFKGKSPDEIFRRGEKDLAKKHYKDSVSEFEAFDALYPFDPRAEQALVDLIFAYYKANDFDSAVATADRYMRLYPMSPKSSYALYMRGVVNMERCHNWIYNAFPCDPAKRDLTNLNEAFHDFQKLLSLYPDCGYAKDAYKRMLHIKHLLARRELQVAEFYYNRHAYIAAANRASYVVQHLCGTAEVPQALVLMVKAYRCLGEQEEADEALQVLKLNYPKHLKDLR